VPAFEDNRVDIAVPAGRLRAGWLIAAVRNIPRNRPIFR